MWDMLFVCAGFFLKVTHKGSDLINKPTNKILFFCAIFMVMLLDVLFDVRPYSWVCSLTSGLATRCAPWCAPCCALWCAPCLALQCAPQRPTVLLNMLLDALSDLNFAAAPTLLFLDWSRVYLDISSTLLSGPTLMNWKQKQLTNWLNGFV